jgi:hypothetical protein
VGSKNAPSTKLFKENATYQKYASMDRIASQASNGVMNMLKISEEARPAWNKWLQKGSWLLVLSTTLTALFFVSSKLFATRRDQKIEQREEGHKHGTVLRDVDGIEANVERSATDKGPNAQVSNITRESTLAAAPQLAQSM